MRAAQTQTRRVKEATTRRATNGSGGTAADGRDEQALRQVLAGLAAMKAGDFTVRMSSRRAGLAGEVARAFNEVADLNARMAKELTRVGRVVGREGRMGERVNLGSAASGWGQARSLGCVSTRRRSTQL